MGAGRLPSVHSRRAAATIRCDRRRRPQPRTYEQQGTCDERSTENRNAQPENRTSSSRTGRTGSAESDAQPDRNPRISAGDAAAATGDAIRWYGRRLRCRSARRSRSSSRSRSSTSGTNSDRQRRPAGALLAETAAVAAGEPRQDNLKEVGLTLGPCRVIGFA